MQHENKENSATNNLDLEYKLQKQKFHYSTLTEPDPGHHEPKNIFAVIIDIRVPYMQGDKWMLNLKVVDHTINQRATSILQSGNRREFGN